MNKKSFFGGLALGLAGILAVGAMGWFTEGFRKWKKSDVPVIEDPTGGSASEDSGGSAQEAGVYDENGNNLADGEVHNMPLALTFTGAKTTASNTSNEITENEDGTKSVELQATFNRNVNYHLDWSLSWVDLYFQGTGDLRSQPISNYLTLTVKEDGGKQATLKMLKRFSWRAQIKVVCRELPTVTKTCNVEYSFKDSSESIDGGAYLYKTESSSYANRVKVGDEADFSAPLFGGIAPYGTIGSKKIHNITGSYTVSVIESDLSATDNYGFRGTLYTGTLESGLSVTSGNSDSEFSLTEGIDLEAKSGSALKLKFEPLTITTDMLKSCFYVEENSGLTVENFYIEGIMLLKKFNSQGFLKTDVTFTYNLDDEVKTFTITLYSSIDASQMEGLKIDVNGMEDVTF